MLNIGPPIVGSAANGNVTFPATYDPLGQSYFLGRHLPDELRLTNDVVRSGSPCPSRTETGRVLRSAPFFFCTLYGEGISGATPAVRA